MITLILICLVPVCWPILAKFFLNKNFTWVEMLANISIGAIIGIVIYAIGLATQTLDVEIWSGQVTGKERVRVSCEHSYSCNCRTVRSCSGSGKNQSCSDSTVCDTCYEHSFDVDWMIRSNIGDFRIDRVDSQGLREPKRYSEVKKDDPVSRQKMFTNYVKGAPESIFHVQPDVLEQSKAVPAYPSQIYDYYKIDRVITQGVNIPNLREWNDELMKLMRTLGPQKQANVVILFTGNKNPSWFYAVEHAWLGGKKNDIIVVIGTPNYPEIEWVRIISWTKQEIFKVTLRDDLQDLKTIDRDKVLGVIDKVTKEKFIRREMTDFEYLKYEIEPPTWVVILAVILGAAASVGFTILWSKK